MKINKIIKSIEKYNETTNKSIDFNNEIILRDIPVDLLEKVKSQNKLLDSMYDEFNMDSNSYIYKFSNTNDPKVKTVIFDRPIYIKDVTLKVDNFIYSKLNKFKVTFYTIDNSSVTMYMLPYEFRGEYIEEIKFSNGQTKSNFKTINNNKLYFYDIIKGSSGDIRLQKLETDYSEYIDEEGFIIFNTQHKKDKLGVKYTPISSEFIKTINDKITSVTLELDNDISNKIELNIINQNL